MKVEKLDISEPEYPELLRQLYDPPQTLYYVGNLEILKLYRLNSQIRIRCHGMPDNAQGLAEVFFAKIYYSRKNVLGQPNVG